MLENISRIIFSGILSDQQTEMPIKPPMLFGSKPG
jgi:hypothetical protein